MKPSRMPAYGGQAIIEGVLMRGQHIVAAAMRSPEGEIVIQTEKLSGIYTHPLFKLPFLRGLIGLWDALGLGMRYLTISANLQSKEEEKIEGGSAIVTVGISLLIAALLFFAGPAWLGHLAEQLFHLNSFTSNLFEGFIRLAAIIGYIWGVGKLPEITRVFAYHGAEHKTINAFEDGAELSPSIVKTYPLEHPRCGTAFLLTLVIFSIILFTLIGPMPGVWRVLSRVILLPVIAGLAYEYIRFTANHLDHPLVRIFTQPNLALQRLTTREPDLSMIEVAITAFSTMRQKEEEYNSKE